MGLNLGEAERLPLLFFVHTHLESLTLADYNNSIENLQKW